MTDQLTHEATQLLERLISIPRTSRNEKEAADMLQDCMTGKYGLRVERTATICLPRLLASPPVVPRCCSMRTSIL